MTDRAYVPIREFRELGYLQEVNRRLLHPLGLAIEVGQVAAPTVRLTLTEDEAASLQLVLDVARLSSDGQEAVRALQAALNAGERFDAGHEVLGGVWDHRDDPEGIVFDAVDAEKAVRIADELNLRALPRMAKLGWVVQPVEP